MSDFTFATPYVKQTNVHWRITDALPNGGDSAAGFRPNEATGQSYTMQTLYHPQHTPRTAQAYI